MLRSDKRCNLQRIWKVTEGKETLKLRFILDRQSIELFVNDGEQVVTTAICTPMEADEIVFSCDGKAKVNVEKYEIVKTEGKFFLRRVSDSSKKESPTFTMASVNRIDLFSQRKTA